MRLVFVTQVLDRGDAVLGFVCRWIEGLAQHVEELRIIALEVGDTTGLPANVSVRELGRRGTLKRLLRYRGLLSEAFGRDGFDQLLTHMVPRYSTMGDGMARRHGAGHALWYTHKGVDKRLIQAVKKVDLVFTASAESMRVETPKKRVTGHGIDLRHFPARAGETAFERGAGPVRVLSVGRMTPAKDPLCVIEAVHGLVGQGIDVELHWAGGGLAAGDTSFADGVRAKVADLGLGARVQLLGDVPYKRIPQVIGQADLMLSASRTGSVDKAVLEAMACGVPAITCNESFPAIFAELGKAEAAGLLFDAGNSEQLRDRSSVLLGRPAAERRDLGSKLRGLVERDHEVDTLMGELVRQMAELRA